MTETGNRTRKVSGTQGKNVVDVARCVFHKPLAESLDGALNDNFPEKAKDDLKIIDVGAGTGLIGI